MKMTDSFLSGSVENYCSGLASPSSAPGGGSAAALCAALGSALASMTCALGCGGMRAHEAEMLLEEALVLVDRDVSAFKPVTEAWKIPRDDPSRAETLEQAHISAAEIPLKLMELCCRLLRLCEELIPKCSAAILPDAASAVALCRSALCAAAVNVRANTYYVKFRSDTASQLNIRADEMLKEYEKRCNDAFAAVYRRMEEA